MPAFFWCCKIRTAMSAISGIGRCPALRTPCARFAGHSVRLRRTTPIRSVPGMAGPFYPLVRRQRYVCINPACGLDPVVERLPGFGAEGARKNLRFTRACVARDLDSGCKPAEDALKREGVTMSRDPIANARQYRPLFAMIAAVFIDAFNRSVLSYSYLSKCGQDAGPV